MLSRESDAHPFCPVAAEWIREREDVKAALRLVLSAFAPVLKFCMYCEWAILALIFCGALAAMVLVRWKGWKWSTSVVCAFALAFWSAVGYYWFIETREARADVTEIATYYYTEDHIGRPFSLRDSEREIRWTEWHEPFGATNTFQSPGDPKTAGSGDYAITWEPGFRFPGQFEAPFENLIPTAQNHYREYLPWFGRYNRVRII